MNLLFILGTRPEAIKLACLIRHCRALPGFDVRVCVTAQHRELLDSVLAAFEITPDHDLDVMRPGQTLSGAAARILDGLDPILGAQPPDWVIVQGDTTTTFAGALAAFHRRIRVAHVEAGLRTGNLSHPFPEEMNRLLTTRLASLHFAPTPWARQNLLSEGVPDAAIHVTGNTGIDAVLYVRGRLSRLGSARSVLITAHRRESFGEPFENICAALRTLALRYPDFSFVFPVHPNPNVRQVVHRALAGIPNFQLLEPLDYVAFVGLMSRAYLILTDSGGIQEEAPSLGKPVLVLRETTERPEGVEAGTVRLVGTSTAAIVEHASRLLDDPGEYNRMARAHNPYGDGRASARIAEILLET
jgi:UDP-N-acetylglucosamine 2-epimerase (non-hydrolysing)